MKGALVVNGKLFKREIKADIIAAADGGYDLLKKRGIVPNIVIGDLDSIKTNGRQRMVSGKLLSGDSSVPVTILPTVKDVTDGEAALDYLIEKGCSDIDIYAATSGRLDHILGHISLLERALNKGVTARLVDDEYEVYLTDKKLEIKIPQLLNVKCSMLNKSTVSLLPLTPEVHIMSASGLKYPLKNETLLRTATRGISNIAALDKISIEIKKGLLLVVVVL